MAEENHEGMIVVYIVVAAFLAACLFGGMVFYWGF